MNLTIRLPGVSPKSDLSLAPQAATIAVTYLQGNLPPVQPPANAGNACSQDPACHFLAKITDSDGKQWLVYSCEDEIVMYVA